MSASAAIKSGLPSLSPGGHVNLSICLSPLINTESRKKQGGQQERGATWKFPE